MAFGAPFGGRLRNSDLAVPTPVYADANDFPIDLRKKAAIRRQRKSEYGSGYRSYSDDEEEEEEEGSRSNKPPVSALNGFPPPFPEEGFWSKNGLGQKSHEFPGLVNPYFLSLRNLHPLLAQQYGIQCTLFTSHDGSRVFPVPPCTQPGNEKDLLSHLKQRSSLDIHLNNGNGFHSSFFRNYDDLQRTSGSKPTVDNTNESGVADKPSGAYAWRKKYLRSHSEADREGIIQQKETHSSQDSPSHSGQLNGSKSDSGKAPRYGGSKEHTSCLAPQLNIRQRNEGLARKSFSCSDLAREATEAPFSNRNNLHRGYDSDNECYKLHHKPSQARVQVKRHSFTEPYKKRKFHHAGENPKTEVEPCGKKDPTLTELLISDSRANQSPAQNCGSSKKGTDVLLHHLRQSPMNCTSKKDGYPWSVYEYYNHLVERFRDPALQQVGVKYLTHSMAESSSTFSLTHGFHDEDDSSNQHRKRPTRALTGKHVKHGTGASLSTLITLRQKIQERQKAKELNGQLESLKIPKNTSRKPKMGNFKRIRTSHLSPSIPPSSHSKEA